MIHKEKVLFKSFFRKIDKILKIFTYNKKGA
jgi:hypothetical protein